MELKLSLKDIDVSNVKSDVDRAVERGLWVTAENVLSDCRPYVPVLTGALTNSGRARVEGNQGYVEWGGNSSSAYARYQYYTKLNHDTPTNAAQAPQATDHWFEAARAVRKEAWVAMFDSEVNNALR